MSNKRSNHPSDADRWQQLRQTMDESQEDPMQAPSTPITTDSTAAEELAATSVLMEIKEGAWLRATQRWDELAKTAPITLPDSLSQELSAGSSQRAQQSQSSTTLDPALVAWAAKISRPNAPAWRRGLAFANNQWRALMDDTARLQQQLQATYQQLLAPQALTAKSAMAPCQRPCALLTGETAPPMGLHADGFWVSVLPHKRYHLHVYLPYLASVALLQLADTPEADDTTPPILLYPNTAQQHQPVRGFHQLLDLALTEAGTNRFLVVFSLTPFGQWPQWASVMQQKLSPEESAEQLAILVLQEIERLATWHLLIDCVAA